MFRENSKRILKIIEPKQENSFSFVETNLIIRNATKVSGAKRGFHIFKSSAKLFHFCKSPTVYSQTYWPLPANILNLYSFGLLRSTFRESCKYVWEKFIVCTRGINFHLWRKTFKKVSFLANIPPFGKKMDRCEKLLE